MGDVPSLTLRVLIGVVASIGLVGVIPVSFAELSTGGACPHLGVIPACHVVSIAYGSIFLTILHHRFWKPRVFLVSWLIIFLLAATGTAFELLGLEACPKTAGGIPKCFFSFGLSGMLFIPFWVHFISSRQNKV